MLGAMTTAKLLESIRETDCWLATSDMRLLNSFNIWMEKRDFCYKKQAFPCMVVYTT